MKDTNDTSITFRTKTSLRKKIEQLAKQDNRTVSNMIETLLMESVQRKTSKK